MTLDERIRQHLEESTSSLRAPHQLEEVMAEGRRRRIRRSTFSVLGAAAVMAAVVSLAPLLMTEQSTGTSAPSVASQATSPPPSEPPPTAVTPNIVPQGIVALSSGAVTVFDQSGSTVAELDLDGARSVYPDQNGGLIYGTDSAIHHLVGGETVTLAEGAVGVGPGVSPNGNPLFYYIARTDPSRVMAVDLSTGEESRMADLAEGEDVTAGGSVLAIVDRSGDCPTLRLVDLEAGEIRSPLGDDCLPVAAGVSVSTNGRYLGVLVGENFRARAIDSGETVLDRAFPDAYMATAGPGGWVVRTPSETVLLAHSGESWNLPAVGRQDWAIPFARPLELAEQAGQEETAFACSPGDREMPDQPLPDAVADTRRRLWNLATSCDAEGLADLARANQTIFSFGGEVDPAEYWESDTGTAMAILAQLLATRPAEDPDAGLWAWPAVQVDPGDEESWAEVADILGDEQVDEMRQAGTGYLGYRVGISSDGRWQYLVGGD